MSMAQVRSVQPEQHAISPQQSRPMVDFGTDEDDAVAASTLLADIGYGAQHSYDVADPRRIVIATPPIGRLRRERWQLPPGPTEAGWDGEIGYVLGGGFLFAHLLLHEPPGADLALLTHQAYGRLLRFVRAGPCPELLRMWNYVAGINGHARGLERYQAFCAGRAWAFAEAAIPAGRFPAATAIGSTVAGLSVHLLAGRRRGRPIENPRQLSAYRYPPRYGPQSPSFARAIRYAGPRGSRELSISGTASIVGHLSMHPHNLRRQLDETLRNLAALRDRAQLGPSIPGARPLLLKAYLRDPVRLPEVATLLHAWADPATRIMFLHGAICRRELMIEIEAHCASPSRGIARPCECDHYDH